MDGYILITFLGVFSVVAANANVDLRLILLSGSNAWSPATEIFFPSGSGLFNDTTRRWNIYNAPTYAASIIPGSEVDVQKVISISFQKSKRHTGYTQI